MWLPDRGERKAAETIGLNRGGSSEGMARLSLRGREPVEPVEAPVADAEPEPEPVA